MVIPQMKKKRIWRWYTTDGRTDYASFQSYRNVQQEVKKAVKQAKKKLERKLAKDAKKNAATADILEHRCNCSPIPSDCIFTGFHNMTALLICLNGISFPIKPRLTTFVKDIF